MFLKNHKANRYLSSMLFSFLLIFFLGNIESVFAQDNFESKPKKGEVVEQGRKEFDKAVRLKVKTRYKHVAFYDSYGKLPAKKTLVEKVTFDRRGLRKERIRYTSLGSVDLRYVFSYDAKGNLVKFETIEGSGNILTRKISAYDKKGNETLRKLYERDKAGESKIEYTYDDSGNLLEAKTFTPKGELFSTIINEYKNDLRVYSASKSYKDEVVQESFFEYDSNRRLIKEAGKELKTPFTIIYTYDSKGNVIEKNDPQFKRNSIYDSNNNLIEDKLFHNDGSRQYRVVFTYYKNGLQKEEIRYSNDDTPVFYGKYDYEFYK